MSLQSNLFDATIGGGACNIGGKFDRAVRLTLEKQTPRNHGAWLAILSLRKLGNRKDLGNSLALPNGEEEAPMTTCVNKPSIERLTVVWLQSFIY